MTDSDWVRGDLLRHRVPAHPKALREGGEDFLTSAFHASGALGTDNRVTRITQFDESSIGGTGQKVFLAVEYEKPAPHLHTELFVKFSRDFTDPVRDDSRHMMESEVRLALLSRRPGFPVRVPTCYFADYHHDSGTGVLITERIAFGRNGIEPCYEKCVDYEVPQALEHYRTLLTANARLAGSHRGKRLGPDIEAQFPYEPQRLLISDRIPYNPAGLKRRTDKLAEFASAYPQLLPANVRSPAFLARLAQDTQRYLAHEQAIKQYLYGGSDFVALCHWNANIDNAWFWRNANGELECGLLDWGRVSQLPLGQAIFGALCAAETDLWDQHLDELLLLFAHEYHRAGGPEITVAELKRHVQLFTALMGIAWVIFSPSVIKQQVPELSDIKDRYDPRFKRVALARVQLQLLTVFLNAWEKQNLGAVLYEILPHLPAERATSCTAAECR